MQEKEPTYSFQQKVWMTTGIVAFAVIMVLLLKTAFSVLMLILAGSLIAIFFRGLAGLVEKKTGWSGTVCLLISTIGTLLIVAAIFWLIGAKVTAQVAELSDTLPATIEKTKAQLQTSSLGKMIVDKINAPESMQKAKTLAQSFFRSSFGVLGDIYVVLFLGIFFTVSPKLYVDGAEQLIPTGGRAKGRTVINTIGENLKKWLKGKLLAMLVVFALTATGLAIIGIPLWLTLAITAGLLNFIPNFGPIIAMIPAVLVAFMQGPNTALLVAGLYIFIQVLESNFITPNIQKKLIQIPPALIIIAQLMMGVLTGGWGLILATPLVAIIMVVVQKTYISTNKE